MLARDSTSCAPQSAVRNACHRRGAESRPWSGRSPSCSEGASHSVRLWTSANGSRTDPSGPGAPRLQRPEDHHDRPPGGLRQVWPCVQHYRHGNFHIGSDLPPLCSCCARLASGLRHALSGPSPTHAHRADGNSFCLSYLRPILTHLRPNLSDLCTVPVTPCSGFDSRRLHQVSVFSGDSCKHGFAGALQEPREVEIQGPHFYLYWYKAGPRYQPGD